MKELMLQSRLKYGAESGGESFYVVRHARYFAVFC